MMWAKFSGKGLRLLGIASLCACSVCFDISRLCYAETGSTVHVTCQLLLCISTGQCEAFGPPVLVARRAPDNGTDWIPVCDGVVHSLQDENSYAITTAATILGRIKGLTPTVSAEELLI